MQDSYPSKCISVNPIMSNTAKALLTITILCIFYYFIPSPTIDISQIEIIRQVESTDEDGQRFIHDRYSPILFISGTSPLEEQNTIADVIELHPDIKQCKNQTVLFSDMLKGFIKRLQVSPREYIRMVENGVVNVYRSAISAYILEILTKQEIRGKVSKILCTRESEFLQYGTEVKLMFPNAKFIRTVVEKDKVLKQIPSIEGNEKFIKRWNENAKNSEQQCKALGPKNCISISIEDWENERKETLGRQPIYDFIFS